MIHVGDCLEVMRTLPEASVDAVVTDPPYGLGFMGKAWDSPAGQQSWTAAGGPFGIDHKKTTARSGSMVVGKYDLSLRAMQAFQAWCTEWGREALRVTVPGGYLLAFGGTRTHHRLVCGLEDAGWIIRDELDWIYASGFPKGKANLKPAHEPIVLARKPGPLRPLAIDACRIGYVGPSDADDVAGKVSKNPTGKAGLYGVPGVATFNEGGRWPSNVLLSDPELFDVANPEVVGSGAVTSDGLAVNRNKTGAGYEGSAYMIRLGPESPDAGYGGGGGYSRFFKVPQRHEDYDRCDEIVNNGMGEPTECGRRRPCEYHDDPEYPKHFIIPKADRADREPVLRGQLEISGNGSYGHKRCAKCGKQAVNVPGSACKCDEPEWIDVTETRSRENAHPTVKPVDLMRHLVRLVTPTGGTVLDPFLGSGSTAIACEMEGFAWIGIEKEAEYVAIAEARLNGVQRGMGLETELKAKPRETIGSFYSGPRKTPTKKWTGVYNDSGGVATGRPGYEDTARKPKPSKPKADTAPLFDGEVA